jgi:hypothetical protein
MLNRLIIHIKCVRNNCFLVISNDCGKILFTKSAGNLGFINIYKRELDLLKKIVIISSDFILGLVGNKILFFKLEGVKKHLIRLIYKKFLGLCQQGFYGTSEINFKIVNKIAHNGCRKKKKKT